MQAGSLRKDFYQEDEHIRRRSVKEVQHCRRLGGVEVDGDDVPNPINAWSQCSLSHRLQQTLQKLHHQEPTPFQANSLPSLLRWRDGLYIAGDDAGSVLSMVLPAGRHVAWQAERAGGKGPIALFISSDSNRIQDICEEMTALFSFCVASAYPGKPLSAEVFSSEVRVLICTPHFTPDIMADNGANLRSISYVVFDHTEALLKAGFGPRLPSIANGVHPAAQISIFAASKNDLVVELCSVLLSAPVHIMAGKPKLLHRSVDHSAIILSPSDKKEDILIEKVVALYSSNRIIIFANSDRACDDIHQLLKKVGLPNLALYEALDPAIIDDLAMDFYDDAFPIAITTDSVACSLHGKGPAHIINYDLPQTKQQYVDRAICAGHASNCSMVSTILGEHDSSFALDMSNILQDSGVDVPADIEDIAETYRIKIIEGSIGNTEASDKSGDAECSAPEVFHQDLEQPSRAAAVTAAAPTIAAKPQSTEMDSERSSADVLPPPVASSTASKEMSQEAMQSNQECGTAGVEAGVPQQKTIPPPSVAATSEFDSTADSPTKDQKHAEPPAANLCLAVPLMGEDASDPGVGTLAAAKTTTKGLVVGSEDGVRIIKLRVSASHDAESDALLLTPDNQQKSYLAAKTSLHAAATIHKEKDPDVSAKAAIGANTMRTLSTKVSKTQWGPLPHSPPPLQDGSQPGTPCTSPKQTLKRTPEMPPGMRWTTIALPHRRPSQRHTFRGRKVQEQRNMLVTHNAREAGLNWDITQDTQTTFRKLLEVDACSLAP